MPVEAFLQTQQRTVLTYFTKPLTDQIARAFRER
jgi:HlyD family secretion protein